MTIYVAFGNHAGIMGICGASASIKGAKELVERDVDEHHRRYGPQPRLQWHKRQGLTYNSNVVLASNKVAFTRYYISEFEMEG